MVQSLAVGESGLIKIHLLLAHGCGMELLAMEMLDLRFAQELLHVLPPLILSVFTVQKNM